MSERRQAINERSLTWARTEKGTRFDLERKQLGRAAGGRQLGCSLVRLVPGKCAWPFHYHCANEEAIYILEGQGAMRIGEDRYDVSPGDYIAFPTGSESAHQLTNTSETPLVYLCISTMINPDVMGYPDSGKIGLAAGSAPGGDKKQRLFMEFHRREDAVDYWLARISHQLS